MDNLHKYQAHLKKHNKKLLQSKFKDKKIMLKKRKKKKNLLENETLKPWKDSKTKFTFNKDKQNL
jgi:hypothetical protein